MGQVQPGQVLVVSGAAGSIGSIVCQVSIQLLNDFIVLTIHIYLDRLVKIIGAKVIGIAGSTEKCNWLIDELGIDAAYNYKDVGWQAKFEAEVGNL